MPTYEYRCKSCGEHVEVVQSFKDDPLTECPACGGPLRKVFGNIGIAFKGSGFYKNDSRPAQKSESGSKTDTKSGDTKTDSKSGDSKSGTSGDTKSSETKTDAKSSEKSSDKKSSPKAAAS